MKNSFTITNEIYSYVETTEFLIDYLEYTLYRIINKQSVVQIDIFAMAYEYDEGEFEVLDYSKIEDAWSAYLDDVEYEKYEYGTGFAYEYFLIECVNNETFRQTYFN